MKILKFATSKGDFALMDGTEQIDQTLKALLDEYTPVAKVSEMTEEQFGEVVDSFELFGNINVGYKNYTEKEPVLDTAKESFESLVKSLGWYLWENPYQDPGLIPSAELDRYRKTNDKVFFNPILLKKI